jgi:hypothetical protein
VFYHPAPKVAESEYASNFIVETEEGEKDWDENE